MAVAQIAEHLRNWLDGLNRGDVSAAPETFAPDCIVHITGSPDPLRGPDAFAQFVGGLLAAFPDVHFEVEDQVESGDTVAVRWTAEGTHTQPLGNIPPTGKRVRIDGIVFDRLAGGKVVERWEQWDQTGMLRQLGLM
ncbi:MAG: ester cyclase [Gemmatimonadota bacterium]|nr:ester cyclase [Gemmatimonadota bacterium]